MVIEIGPFKAYSNSIIATETLGTAVTGEQPSIVECPPRPDPVKAKVVGPTFCILRLHRGKAKLGLRTFSYEGSELRILSVKIGEGLGIESMRVFDENEPEIQNQKKIEPRRNFGKELLKRHERQNPDLAHLPGSRPRESSTRYNSTGVTS